MMSLDADLSRSSSAPRAQYTRVGSGTWARCVPRATLLLAKQVFQVSSHHAEQHLSRSGSRRLHGRRQGEWGDNGSVCENGVCIYLDNSNIFIEAQRLAAVRNGNSADPSVRHCIRVDLEISWLLQITRLCSSCRIDTP